MSDNKINISALSGTFGLFGSPINFNRVFGRFGGIPRSNVDIISPGVEEIIADGLNRRRHAKLIVKQDPVLLPYLDLVRGVFPSRVLKVKHI